MSKSCRPRSPSPLPSLTSSTAYLPTTWPNSPSPGQSPAAPATCSNSSIFNSLGFPAKEGGTASAHCRKSDGKSDQEQFAAEIISPFAPAGDPDEQTFRAALAGALAELPAEQRAVVHLKLWDGLTFEQIAGALDIPLNTAASRYRYGLDKLRERLRPIYEEMKKAE